MSINNVAARAHSSGMRFARKLLLFLVVLVVGLGILQTFLPTQNTDIEEGRPGYTPTEEVDE